MFAVSQFENRLVKPVMEALKGCDVTFAILPDHPVPIHERAHTRTPVPVAVCGKNIQPDAVEKYGESFVKNGSLGAMSGEEFMRLVLGLK
jgi:2,3-bisphosphoglycerate-independent phosphoglycerate mutase